MDCCGINPSGASPDSCSSVTGLASSIKLFWACKDWRVAGRERPGADNGRRMRIGPGPTSRSFRL